MTVAAPPRPSVDYFPNAEEYKHHLGGRRRRARWFQLFSLFMLSLAVLALSVLLYTIVNDSFGLVAIINENEPEDLVASLGHDPEVVSMGELSFDELVILLEGAASSGVGRRLEREQRFYADRLVFESEAVWDEICASDEPPTGCNRGPRDISNVLQLVNERVVVPDVIMAYELVPSLFSPERFEEEVDAAFAAGRFPEYTRDQAFIEWRAWFNPTFLLTPQSSTPEIAGIRTAILGSFWLVLITLAFAVPVGVGAAIYLVEYAKPTRFNGFIQTNINNLAGVPSIVYGMLGLAIFVRLLEPLTSGAMFTDGVPPSDNGRTIISAGFTMGLLTLPVVIISAQEALKAVPDSLRQAGLALGATRWQTVRSQILPVALPGILTGTILAVARAVGETAPLILVGAASFITSDPSGPFSKFTALPIQIFQWTSFPQEEFHKIAAAASLALLVLLLTLNAAAVILRNRFSRRVE
ncbi:MAG: phosphate ABC transporter permease PstA [Actinobacteria bacterium]|nr:phosphate ABC transporter permease PstA [Actinomycetota bacterium]MCI0543036.1 phosphate ABC transporter permease PstA [Actinomycetota bacterium]MCI0678825.1 phosphate ABC transporter permease PstA [Actinomycetota bacterium]